MTTSNIETMTNLIQNNFWVCHSQYAPTQSSFPPNCVCIPFAAEVDLLPTHISRRAHSNVSYLFGSSYYTRTMIHVRFIGIIWELTNWCSVLLHCSKPIVDSYICDWFFSFMTVQNGLKLVSLFHYYYVFTGLYEIVCADSEALLRIFSYYQSYMYCRSRLMLLVV